MPTFDPVLNRLLLLLRNGWNMIPNLFVALLIFAAFILISGVVRRWSERVALRAGRKLVIGEKTIVTPAARDLGEANKVFVQAGWPR